MSKHDEHPMFYGMDRNGNLVHINAVASGLECDLRCLECNWPLSASKAQDKSADKRAYTSHFKHAPANDERGQPSCTPENANETAMHKLGKEVFRDIETFSLPEYRITPGEKSYRGQQLSSILVRPKTTVTVKDITIEDTSLSKMRTEGLRYRPDITFTCVEHGRVAVEIVVSNRMSLKKIDAYAKDNINTLSINLRNVLLDDSDIKEKLRHTVQHPERCKWSPIVLTEAENAIIARETALQKQSINRAIAEQEDKEKAILDAEQKQRRNNAIKTYRENKAEYDKQWNILASPIVTGYFGGPEANIITDQQSKALVSSLNNIRRIMQSFGPVRATDYGSYYDSRHCLWMSDNNEFLRQTRRAALASKVAAALDAISKDRDIVGCKISMIESGWGNHYYSSPFSDNDQKKTIIGATRFYCDNRLVSPT